jgi:catechol 2,3-dioxygenase-like lactoylglutathione lyase family enzyme
MSAEAQSSQTVPLLQTKGIDHVVLHVSDIARSKQFYIDLLGMTVDYETSWQAFLECGSQGVALFEVKKGLEIYEPIEEPGIHGGSEMNHMALKVDLSHQEAKQLLEEAGIKVVGRTGDPDCIYFNDPDNHRLQLIPTK